MAEPIILGKGSDGTVQLDPESMLVCKRFHDADDWERLHRESEYLQRVSEILSHEPYVHCPELVAVDYDEGEVWMTFCEGVPLDQALAEGKGDVEKDLDHIAEQIAAAVDRYVNHLDEPFYSLRPYNMVYDSESGILSVVDFGGAPRNPDVEPEHAHLEVTLGRLVGRSLYRTVGPNSIWNFRYVEGVQQLLREVLANMDARYELCADLILRISTYMFKRRWRHHNLRRQLWYATAGNVAFHRRSRAVMSRLSQGN